jgi:diguanylate cyclase (GGDEF)-like protein
MNADKRFLLVFYLTLFGVFFLITFGSYSLFTDNLVTGVVLNVFALLGLSNLLLLFGSFQHQARRNLSIIIFFIILSLIALGGRGDTGYIWTFPLITIAIMVLSLKEGFLFSVLLLVAQVIIVFDFAGLTWTVQYETTLAIRYIASCIATCGTTLVLISIQHSTDKRLQLKSVTDELTGLYNRGLLDAKPSLTQVSKDGDRVFLLLIDIDHFKRVNDNFGHGVGDKLLVAFSETIKSTLRKNDTIIRWGGEEFLVLLALESDDMAKQIAEKVRENFKNAQSVMELGCGRQTLSIGVSEMKHDESIDLAVKRADEALYKAKQTGRDKVMYNSLYSKCADLESADND